MNSKSITPATIINQTFEFNYEVAMGAIYEIAVLSDSTLHWKLTKGEYGGPQEGDEIYYVNQVTEDILLISWVEKSGLGLYSTLNFNTGELITHARGGDTTHINIGTIKAID